MTTWRVDPSAKYTAESLICFLADSCNRASSHDAAGFSKYDAEFGHSLANRARAKNAWTVKQANAALKMIQKYQRQLCQYNITEWLQDPVFYHTPVDHATNPVAHKPLRKLTSCDSNAVFAFAFDAALINDIKAIRGKHKDQKFWASWDAVTKTWTVPVNETSIELIMAVAKRYDFEIEERFINYGEKVREKTMMSRTMLQLNGDRHIIVSCNTIDIYINDVAILDQFAKELNVSCLTTT